MKNYIDYFIFQRFYKYIKKDLKNGFVPNCHIWMTPIDYIDIKKTRDMLNFSVLIQICMNNNCKVDIKTHDTIGYVIVIENFNLPSISFNDFLACCEKANQLDKYVKEKVEVQAPSTNIFGKKKINKYGGNSENVVFVDFKSKKRVS